jgi:hypothetical protein
LLATFIVPIGAMLGRAFDRQVAEIMPRVTTTGAGTGEHCHPTRPTRLIEMSGCARGNPRQRGCASYDVADSVAPLCDWPAPRSRVRARREILGAIDPK